MNEKYPEALKTGTILHGHTYEYVIVKPVGQGSFGITYLASLRVKGALGSIDADVKVAIKEFFMRDQNGREGQSVTYGSKRTLSDGYRMKFVREAQKLGELKYPGIINVIEQFDENDTSYYAMEYHSGGSVNDFIRINKSSNGGIDQLKALRLTEKVAEALRYMHSKKMIHLDLKPDNILMKGDDDIVLIDFGLTKCFDENGVPESNTSIKGGTPGYSPIEQLNYKEGDGFPVTLDIYALGATMYKMLTGSTPPEASDILNDGFPSKLTYLNEDVWKVVERFMSPMRKNRPQTDEEVISLIRNEITKLISHYATIKNNEIKINTYAISIVLDVGGYIRFRKYDDDEKCIGGYVYEKILITITPEGMVNYTLEFDGQQRSTSRQLTNKELQDVHSKFKSMTNTNTQASDISVTVPYLYIFLRDTRNYDKSNHMLYLHSDKEKGVTGNLPYNGNKKKLDINEARKIYSFIPYLDDLENELIEDTSIVEARIKRKEERNKRVSQNAPTNHTGKEHHQRPLENKVYKELEHSKKEESTKPIKHNSIFDDSWWKYIGRPLVVVIVLVVIFLCKDIRCGSSTTESLGYYTEEGLSEDSVAGIAYIPVEDDEIINYQSSEATGYVNGHGYVDLGLPSGVKWSVCNIGAFTPSGYGDYYGWGEVETKVDYKEHNSKFYRKNRKQFDISGNTEFDVATYNWGEKWRMPTTTDFKELIAKCKWGKTTLDGHNGYAVIGPNGNSIFIPLAGEKEGDKIYWEGECGSYWSSSANTEDPGYFCYLNVSSLQCEVLSYGGPVGKSIRPIIK